MGHLHKSSRIARFSEKWETQYCEKTRGLFLWSSLLSIIYLLKLNLYNLNISKDDCYKKVKYLLSPILINSVLMTWWRVTFVWHTGVSKLFPHIMHKISKINESPKITIYLQSWYSIIIYSNLRLFICLVFIHSAQTIVCMLHKYASIQ